MIFFSRFFSFLLSFLFFFASRYITLYHRMVGRGSSVLKHSASHFPLSIINSEGIAFWIADRYAFASTLKRWNENISFPRIEIDPTTKVLHLQSHACASAPWLASRWGFWIGIIILSSGHRTYNIVQLEKKLKTPYPYLYHLTKHIICKNQKKILTKCFNTTRNVSAAVSKDRQTRVINDEWVKIVRLETGSLLTTIIDFCLRFKGKSSWQWRFEFKSL